MDKELKDRLDIMEAILVSLTSLLSPHQKSLVEKEIKNLYAMQYAYRQGEDF